MNELILLRHAEAESAKAGEDDAGRPLNARGEQEARAAGQWLADHGITPDRVLCSPAARTRATAQLALEALGQAAAITTEDGIYDATPGDLMALLDQHGEAGTLLLVGHNPGIEQLVALLSEGRSDEYRGMPPAALAVLHLQSPLEPGHARLDAFWSP